MRIYIVLYYTDVYIVMIVYKILNEKKICIHIYKLQTWRYIHECIYTVMCVCIYIYITCIYVFLRGVRQIVRRKGNLHFGSAVAFSGNLTSLRQRNLFRSSDPKLCYRRESPGNEKGKTSKRDQFKIVPTR